jgi:hypothetical protein
VRHGKPPGEALTKNNAAVDRLVRILQYRRPETDERPAEAADRADVLETLEEGTNAIESLKTRHGQIPGRAAGIQPIAGYSNIHRPAGILNQWDFPMY